MRQLQLGKVSIQVFGSALAIFCFGFCLAFSAEARVEGVIYQAFNQRFVDIDARLDRLNELGYRYIQVSPPQKSIDNSIWWGRYQPVDFRKIEGPLGNERQLRTLIANAHQRGLKVLIDVVLNHMADPVFYPAALNYPQFSYWDFHYHESRPCITDYNDRHQTTKFWLCDPAFPDRRLPDLDTSSNYVRRVHKDYINWLLSMGADGFRIDAAKHIEPEYFDWFKRQIPRDKFFYGEVIGGGLEESQLYLPHMRVTDFQILGTMLQAFSFGGSLESLIFPEGFGAALPGDKAVVFARNHDTAMHEGFFNFNDYEDMILGNAYLLARGQGIPMIYRDDYRHKTVVAGVEFYNRTIGKGTYIRRASELCGEHVSCTNQILLGIERGDDHFALINKSGDWIDVPSGRLPGIRSGCYREISYNTVIAIASGGDGQRWVQSWATRERGGFRIGPRTALFFRLTDDKNCPR